MADYAQFQEEVREKKETRTIKDVLNYMVHGYQKENFWIFSKITSKILMD